MKELLLYSKLGEVLLTITPDESSLHDWSLMGENKLSISFELDECIVLSPGCYVEFDDIRYYLLDEYKPKMKNSVTWEYNVAFLDAASWMSIVLAINTLDGQNAPIFNYTGSAREHAEIIVANLNRRMGITSWKVGEVIDTQNIYIEYSGKYCSQVLQEVVDNDGTEWWVDGYTLNIGRAEFGEAVELGYGNGLLGDIVREQADAQRSYAYLIPVGSKRNIDPAKYGYDRLQLPNGQIFVDISPEHGIGELIEERPFAEIYPRYEGSVKSVRSVPAKDSNGKSYTIYYIGDTLPFNPNNYEIGQLVKHITFQSGELTGQEFEVNWDAISQEFEIITRFPNGDTQLPGGLMTPAIGDKYIIWNISMPDEYYDLASQEYLEAATKYAASIKRDTSVYKATLDYIEAIKRGISVRPGRKVRLLSDEYFPTTGYYDSRITRMTRRVWYPHEITIDVSAVRVVGSITRLRSSIQKAETQIAQLSGLQPTYIKSGEQTRASDKTVYTSAKSEEEFLNKRKGGTVAAPVTFESAPEFKVSPEFVNGISGGGGSLFRYNADLGAWILSGNLIVEKDIAWHASDKPFTPHTIMDAVQVDGKTISKEGGVLSYIGGTGGGVADSIDWANVDNKPTTISGYGITDAYTKTAVDNLISSLNTTLFKAIDTKWTQDDNLINEWNTAYGWGNHADVGYAKATDVANELKKYVLLDTAQKIAAQHNFENGLQVGGALFRYDASKKAWVLPNNLVVEGGIAWNSSIDGFEPKTITDAVQIDGVSIKRNADGILYAEVGTGGITSITSQMVVDALGYTPLSSNGGEITGELLLTGDVFRIRRAGNTTMLFSPSDGNVNVWFGINTDGQLFVTNNGCTQTYKVLNDNNIKNYTLTWLDAQGVNYSRDVSTILDATLAGGRFVGAPDGLEYGAILTLPYRKASGNLTTDFATQIYIPNGDYAEYSIRWRGSVSNDWGGWRKLLDSANYSDYAIQYLGGTSVDSARHAIGYDNESQGSVNLPTGGGFISADQGSYGFQLLGSAAGGKLYWRQLYGGSLGSWTRILDGDNYSDYALPITGGEMKGDIILPSGKYVRTGGEGNYAMLGIDNGTMLVGSPEFPLTIRSNGSTSVNSVKFQYDDEINRYGGDLFIQHRGVSSPTSDGTTGNVYICLNGGSVAIGGRPANSSAKLHIFGNVIATGEISWNSSLVLKDVVGERFLSLDDLRKLKPYNYYWKDGRDDKLHAGAVADYVLPVLPEVILTDTNNIHSMDYGQGAWVVGTSLVPIVDKHEDEIADIKRRLYALEQKQ
jgi:hypothetical protein